MSAPAIIVHDLRQAIAALAAAASLDRVVRLRSAPGAAAALGPRVFARMMQRAAEAHPEASFTAVLDCAGDAGYALQALRAGVPAVRVAAEREVFIKLADIAIRMDAEIEHAAEIGEVLDLDGENDPEAACRAWLQLTPDPPIG